MPLQDQVVSVPFSEGVDTKTDPKAVQVGKLLSLSNGTFPQGNQITKRNGYTNLTGFQSLLTRSFDNQLLLGDGINLYAYSADTQIKKIVGNYTSVSVTPTNIPISRTGARCIRTASFVAASGSYACTCYIVTDPSGTSESMYVTVIDSSNGVVLLSDISVSANIPILGTVGHTWSQVFVINGNTSTPSFGILYPGQTTALAFASVTVSGSSAVISAGHILSGNSVTSFNAINSGGASTYVSWISDAGGTLTPMVGLLVGNAFTTTATAATVTGGSVYTQTASCFDTSGNIWTLFSYEDTGATTATLKYFVYPPSLGTPVLNTTTVTTYAASGGDSFDPSAIALSPQLTGAVRAYYSRKTVIGTEGSANAAFFFTTFLVNLTSSGGVGTPILFMQNAELQSNFVTYNSRNYVVMGNVLPAIAALFGYSGTTNATTTLSDENTYFLVDEATGDAIGKCLYGTAIPVTLDEFFCATGSGTARPNVNTLTVNGTSLYFGAGTILENTNQSASGSNNLTQLVQTGAKLEQFNFSDPQAYQSAVFQNTAAFNGAVVKGYDGDSLTELGFLTYPDFMGLTAGTGGNMTAGVYGYAATYAWTDAVNQQYESFPLQISVTVASSGSVAIVIQTLGLTEKGRLNGQAPYINIYRTDVNGTIYYFLARIPNPYSSANVNYYTASYPVISYTDVYGPSLAGQPELYNTGGVLENDPPPPSMILTVREDRLYAVDSENPNTDYWYTKSQNKGYGISFSAFLVETIDSVGGAITSQAQMDEKLVTFKETTLGYQVGDGPNDTGANSTLSNFQFIPADTGSNNHRATIVIPNGTMFQSDKGLYMLGRGLQVTYAGAAVDQYKSQFITQATMLQQSNAVRYLVSSGVTLIYNYFYDQWGTFTNHTGTSADVFQQLYTYSRYDGKVFQENLTTFLDDSTPYSMSMQIAWLKFGNIQGFQRIKQMLVLGDHASPAAGHGIMVAPSYNYSATIGTPIPFTFTANGLSQINFQYRDFFAQQKCDSLSLTITEVVTGASGEYIDLTDLTFLVGVKKGLHKLSAANSVG